MIPKIYIIQAKWKQEVLYFGNQKINKMKTEYVIYFDKCKAIK